LLCEFSSGTSLSQVCKKRVAPHLSAFEDQIATVHGTARRMNAAERTARSELGGKFERLNPKRPGNMGGCVPAANDSPRGSGSG